jgi:hypothetical protein
VAAAIAVSLLFAAVGAGAAAAPPLVIVQLPQSQTMKELLRGKFVQTLTCRYACKVTARIFISPHVARKLHFSGLRAGVQEPYLIALRNVRLVAGKATRIYVRLSAEAKRRLPTWKKALRLTGEDYAQSTSSSARGQASWITILRR